MLVLVFIAQIHAWLKEWRHRDLEKILKELGDRRAEVIKMFNKKVASAQEVETWIDDYKELRKQIWKKIADGLGEAEASVFRTIGVFRLLSFGDEAISENHATGVSETRDNWRSRMHRDFKHLEELIKDYSRHKRL